MIHLHFTFVEMKTFHLLHLANLAVVTTLFVRVQFIHSYVSCVDLKSINN